MSDETTGIVRGLILGKIKLHNDLGGLILMNRDDDPSNGLS
jgi:hypothetical protein